MTQGVLDLIQAIDSGDSVAIDAAFNAEMASRVSAKLDDLRVEVAENMFNEAYKCKSKMKESECDDEDEDEKKEMSEEVMDEMINEVLGKNADAGTWIKDFVSSDNPKFAGKSKEKRKQMALAAYYAKQRNEELDIAEMLDYLSENEEVLAELSKATMGSYVKKASGDLASSIHAERDAEESDDEDERKAMAKRAEKRMSGLEKAGKKIAK